MHKVTIESDAAYRETTPGLPYQEVCTACGIDRVGTESRCGCGQEFARKESGFFKAGWSPPELEIAFPERCPKTLGPATRKLTFGTRRVTGATGAGGVVTHLLFEVPVGPKLRNPLLPYFSGVVTTVLAAVFGLMCLFSAFDDLRRALITGGLALACLVGTIFAYREYTWFRVASYNHRCVIFKVRRLEYARELASGNKGRIR